MWIYEGLKWRYKLYMEPYLLLHENIPKALARSLYNWNALRHAAPVCYLSADATNIGDRVSSLGVQYLAGRPGAELFISRVALQGTIKTLVRLRKEKPRTRVIIGGGGLLQECFIPFWRELLQTGLQFEIFGVGANEIDGGRSLPPVSLLEEIFSQARSLHVRDNWTRQLLQRSASKRVSVGLCPSVNYLVARYGNTAVASRPYLLHVEHPVDVRMAGGDPEHHVAVLKEVAAQLGLQYDHTNHIKLSLDTLVQRYHRARYIVSSRLHGCIFSYAAGRPFLPIISDRKTVAFVAAHLPNNPTVSVHFTPQEIIEKLQQTEAMQNADFFARRAAALAENVKAMKLASEWYDTAEDTVSERRGADG